MSIFAGQNLILWHDCFERWSADEFIIEAVKNMKHS